ncbi:MAG: tetratricopeptide repeat protein, partial [Vicinamibacterales bacterium]
VGLTVLVSTLWGAGPSVAQTPNRVLVMPFENVAHDGRIVWLGEAAAVLLAEGVNARGARALARDERREGFAHLQIPTTATLSDATTIRIGQIVGASSVVLGTLLREDETLVVRARSIALDTGRVQDLGTERAPIAELFAIFERIASRLVPTSSAAAGVPARPNPSIAAFENYIKGLLAETPATALTYLNASLRAQPSFDRAKIALWEVYEELGDHDRSLASVASILQTSEVYRRARFLVGLSQLGLRRHDEAFSTFKLLADSQSTPALWNNLGVVQLRRGGSPQTGLPEYFFNKASEGDPSDPDYFFNLGYTYWFGHDVQAAVYWLREAVRRAPADGDAHYVLGVALASAANLPEANREKELARRLSSTYAEWEKRPANDPVPRGLERLKPNADVLRIDRIDAIITTTGLRDQRELATFYLDRGRRLFEQGSDREAMAELGRTLFLSPYDADAHLLMGRLHLRAGRTREAIDAGKIAIWSRDSEQAHVLLAEAYLGDGNPDEAEAEARRALVLNSESAAAKAVLQALASR